MKRFMTHFQRGIYNKKISGETAMISSVFTQGGALRGYKDVLESWASILGAPEKTKITPINPIATIAVP